jgi:Ion channel
MRFKEKNEIVQKPTQDCHRVGTGYIAFSVGRESAQIRGRIRSKMLAVMFIAAVLVAISVAIHAVGLGVVLSHMFKSHAAPPTQAWRITLLLVRVAWMLILVHTIEICVWALFYVWEGCMPNAESAFYFSGVTYTTIGYGDLVLTKPWRMLGPIEGLTGTLMCALSAGVFFAAVNRIYSPALREDQK